MRKGSSREVKEKEATNSLGKEGLGRGWGTHFGLVDEQHHVGESVQCHVDRQLHGAGVADAAPGGSP